MSLPRQFLIYGVGGAASRLAAIFLVPLYTRALSMEDYGQLEVLLALHLMTVLIAGMQSESAVIRDYYEAEATDSLHRLKWASVLITLCGTCLVAAGALGAHALGLLPAGMAQYIPWLLAMTLSAQLLGIQLILLRFAGRPVLFASLSFLDLSLSALASAVFIIGLDMGITGALAGITAGKTLCVALAWRGTFGSAAAGRPPLALVRRMLAYAVPTMPAVLLNWLQTNGTRVLLAVFLTLTDVALAGIAIKVAALYGFLAYSFRLAWEPYAFQSLSRVESDPGVYNRALQWYIVLMFLAAGAATLASPLLVSIFAPPVYGEAIKLTGIFIIGQFWTGAITILSIGIHGARVTSRLTHVFGAGATLNILCLALLAPYVGVTAAAIGYAASAMVSALLAAHYSEKHFETRFDKRLMAWTLLASAIFASICYRLLTRLSADIGQDWLVLGAMLTSLVLLMGLVCWFGIGAARMRNMWLEALVLVRSKAAN